MAKLQADDSRKRARAPAVAARKKPAKKTPEPQEQTDEDAESDAHTGADATNTGDDNTGDDNTGDEGAQEEAAESASEDDAPVKRKKTKAAPKPKAKPAGKQAAKAPVAKKRRVRSQEDKLRENAPMNQPFFVETGSDWGSTDIDFEELSVLRGMWELPAACHILWLLQHPLTLRFSHKLVDFEAALLNPTASMLLEDVFTKLLLKKSERECLSAGIGLKYEWWNKQLREYYTALYDKWYALLRKAGEKLPESFSDDEDDDEDGDDDQDVDVELSDDEWMALDILKARLEALGAECPLKHKSFAELSVELRCKMLLNLCEAVIDDPSNTEHVRMMEEDDMRVEPLGRDRAGNCFYFFPQFYEERRLYRLELATNTWGLWAKGDACFRDALAGMRALRGRKVPGEQELLDHLEVIVEQLEEEAAAREKELEKATRRAILEAIPRKRSVRIQVKQIEQMEQQAAAVAEKQQLTLEELAELKRAELLRRVEQEAQREARERAREAERAALEQREREAAAAERELRRQRRLEKEREDEALQRRQERERQQEREARELRAKQRKAAEEHARLQADLEAVADASP